MLSECILDVSDASSHSYTAQQFLPAVGAKENDLQNRLSAGQLDMPTGGSLPQQ